MDLSKSKGIAYYQRTEEKIVSKNGTQKIVPRVVDVISLAQEISRLRFDPAAALVKFATDESFDERTRLSATKFIAERIFPVPTDSNKETGTGVTFNVIMPEEKKDASNVIYDEKSSKKIAVNSKGKINILEKIGG